MVVFLYIGGIRPLRDFANKNFEPCENFCIFSTVEKANEHFYNQNKDNWYPDNEEDIKWGNKNIWILNHQGDVLDCKKSSDLSSEALAEFVIKYVSDNKIIEMKVDV